MTTKTLVTGASGFIGRVLVKKLADQGFSGRRGLRNAPPGDPPAGWEDIAVGDIDAFTDWSRALADVGTIVHLAARVHVMHAGTLADYTRVNVDATARLASQAASAGARRFIYLSTIKVLGESTEGRLPFSESDEPDPRDAYAISKLRAERTLREIASETGMETVIIRPPLVYGPGVKGNFLTLMQWTRWGIPLPLGAVTNKRTLLALDNLTDLIHVCLTHPAAADQTFHAGDAEDVSTAELLRRIGHALGRPARLFPLPDALLKRSARLLGREDVIERLCGSLQVDIRKARDVLGWVPRVGMEEELARTVAGL
jgi:nucleoside-diphosphate-sugar epimerase